MTSQGHSELKWTVKLPVTLNLPVTLKMTHNFSIWMPWATLNHSLYFDGYCRVASNSQDTSLGLLVEIIRIYVVTINLAECCTCVQLDLHFLTHIGHFMYFHGYCKITSNSQFTSH